MKEKIKLCSKCGKEPARTGQRYCKSCHAESMRKYRKLHPPSKAEKIKMACRSYAGTYQRRGLLIQQPCQVCGCENSQKHHPDYSKPLEVEWLCRECHLKFHRENSQMAIKSAQETHILHVEQVY